MKSKEQLQKELIFTSRNLLPNCIEFLLKSGADPNYVECEEYCPDSNFYYSNQVNRVPTPFLSFLHQVSVSRSCSAEQIVDITKIFIDYGANPNLVINLFSKSSQSYWSKRIHTPWDYFSQNDNSLAIFKYLFENSDINPNLIWYNFRDREEKNPLMSCNFKLDLLSLLLENGAKTNFKLKDEKAHSPLLQALCFKLQGYYSKEQHFKGERYNLRAKQNFEFILDKIKFVLYNKYNTPDVFACLSKTMKAHWELITLFFDPGKREVSRIKKPEAFSKMTVLQAFKYFMTLRLDENELNKLAYAADIKMEDIL